MNSTDCDTDFGQFSDYDNLYDFPEDVLGYSGRIGPDDSPQPASPNSQDRHELDPNEDVTQSQASSSSNAQFYIPPHQSPARCKQKRKKDGSQRKEYGKGPDHQMLEKMPHFGESFKHLELYKLLGRPSKEMLIKIGRKYNNDHRQEIKLKLLPKFTRNHSRRFDLAYFFIDDNKSIIIPWLTKIRMNSPDF